MGGATNPANQQCPGGVCSVRGNTSTHTTASSQTTMQQAQSIPIKENDQAYNIYRDGQPLQNLKYCEDKLPRKNLCAKGKNGEWYKILTQDVTLADGKKTKEFLLANGEKVKDTAAKQEYACLYNRWIDSDAWKLAKTERENLKQALVSNGMGPTDCSHVPPSLQLSAEETKKPSGDLKIAEDGSLSLGERKIKFATDTQTGEISPVYADNHHVVNDVDNQLLRNKAVEIHAQASKNTSAQNWLSDNNLIERVSNPTPREIIAAAQTQPKPQTPENSGLGFAMGNRITGVQFKIYPLDKKNHQPTQPVDMSKIPGPPHDPSTMNNTEQRLAGAEQVDQRQNSPEPAKPAKKIKMLKFGAVWCPPCKAMNPIVNKMISDGYDVLPLDADLNPDHVKGWKVESLPTFIFIDENNNEVSRIEGPTTAEQLKKPFEK